MLARFFWLTFLDKSYDKKREVGNPFRVAIIACVNKLLNWLLLTKKQNYFQGYRLGTISIYIQQNPPKVRKWKVIWHDLF